LLPVRGQPVIPLFDQETDHSLAPTKVRSAVARSDGQGRPSGRRFCPSPLTGARRWQPVRSLGTMVCIVLIFALSMLLSNAARASGLCIALRGFCQRGVQAFRGAGTLDRAVLRVEIGDQSRTRSQKGAMRLMRIMPKGWANYALTSNPSIRTTTSWPVGLTSSNSHRVPRRVQVSGTLVGSTQLASGRFAMIDDGIGFQLAPWQPVLDKRIGEYITGTVRDAGGIEWSFGRKRGLGI
jgi:hypothetical protein